MPEKSGASLEPAEAFVCGARERGIRVVLAESCTAGLVADLLVRVPGASRVLWGSFVSYGEGAKEAMLGLDAALLAEKGAASREAALAMAEGALARSGADIALSVTGLAGPEGDGTGTPLGTVWTGLARRGGAAEARCRVHAGDRNAIRQAAAAEAVAFLLEVLGRSAGEDVP